MSSSLGPLLFAFLYFGIIAVVGSALIAVVAWLLLQVLRKTPTAQTNGEKSTGNGFEATLGRANLYEIRMPQGAAWEAERAKDFMRHMLVTIRELCIFRIVAEPGRIAWQIIDGQSQSNSPESVVQAIRVMYPEAQVSVSKFEEPILTKPFYRGVLLFKLVEDFYAPIKTVLDLAKPDPLSAMVAAIAIDLQAGERLTYTLLASKPLGQSTIHTERQKLQRSTINIFHAMSPEGWGVAAARVMTGTNKTAKFVPELQKIFQDKMNNDFLWAAFPMLQIDVVAKAHMDRMDNVMRILGMQFASDFNGIVPAIEESKIHGFEVNTDAEEKQTSTMGIIGTWIDGQDEDWKKVWCGLGTSELSALWHLPHKEFSTPAINWLPQGRVKAPQVLLNNRQGVVIGDNDVDGKPTPIHLPDTSRNAHINIIGRPGVGKSTFMHNLIHHDIESGRGVGVVDPHGKLVNDILRYSIPKDRLKDVVLIDIADENNPPPLNLLSVSGEFAIGQTISILEIFYREFVSVGDVMRNVLAILESEDTPTLRDVPRVINDLAFRQQLLEKVHNVAALDFWDEFNQQSVREQRESVRPVTRRIRSLYGNDILYPMICHPHALDFRQLMADGKIILISLKYDQTKVPEHEQRLLGAVLVSQLQMAAMNSEKSIPFFLYIDEVQEFVTSSIDKMLAQARKFNLHLTIANQYLGQLKGATLEAVTGTTGATVAFQLGPDDARELAPHFRPEFEIDNLINLDKYQAAVKVRLANETLRAFSITTPLPIQEPDGAVDWVAHIREESRRQWTPWTRQQVLDWLETRYPRPNFGPSGDEGSANPDDWVVPPEPQ